jgi:NhaP-type Na+/H+ and K+/H+ antiporter
MDLPDEIQSTAHELEVTEEMLVSGCTLREIQMPPHTLIIMVRRGEDFFGPTGASELLTGDQLLVITDHDADAAYRQLTNEAEEEAQWRADVRARAKERFQRFQEWLEAPRMKTKSKLNNQDND